MLEVLELVPFETELKVVNKLYIKGKSLLIDIAIIEAFTQDLVSSILRDPNALMCMTKIREKETYLIEHSLNEAILLANFGAYIDLDKDKSKSWLYQVFCMI